jgi:hypothetical protein
MNMADIAFEGYHYECSCGELYKSVAQAECCRKCRTYTERGWCTAVTDVRTSKVVWVSPIIEAERVAAEELATYTVASRKAATLGDVAGVRDALKTYLDGLA